MRDANWDAGWLLFSFAITALAAELEKFVFAGRHREQDCNYHPLIFQARAVKSEGCQCLLAPATVLELPACGSLSIASWVDIDIGALLPETFKVLVAGLGAGARVVQANWGDEGKITYLAHLISFSTHYEKVAAVTKVKK